MRVFMGLTEVAGIYSGLQRGFNALGIPSVCMVRRKHRFQYDGRYIDGMFIKLVEKRLHEKRCATPRTHILAKICWAGSHQFIKDSKPFLIFVWAICNFDVFLFSYRTSFFRGKYHLWDLPILKFFGKKIIYYFHGSDGRPPYIDGAEMAPDRRKTITQCIEMTRQKKNIIRSIERYADYIISYPLYAQLHERSIISRMALGRAVQLPDSRVSTETLPTSDNQPIRILHSPSHPEAKGTPCVRQAIQSLQARNYHLEYVEITGQPHVVVIQELQQCDIVIDQLYSDLPMSAFASEAAFYGKAVIMGCYGIEEMHQCTSSELMPPIHYCHPDDIATAIEELITDDDYRTALGQQAKAYIQTYCQPEQVAKRFLQLIEGTFPTNWLYDPNGIHYIYGSGIPEWRAKELVRGVIAEGGKAALQLSDKPELEQLFVAFAEEET